jgi:hypothetical protein
VLRDPTAVLGHGGRKATQCLEARISKPQALAESPMRFRPRPRSPRTSGSAPCSNGIGWRVQPLHKPPAAPTVSGSNSPAGYRAAGKHPKAAGDSASVRRRFGISPSIAPNSAKFAREGRGAVSKSYS